jgi:WD domain, G-beta repeat/KAP family P-loop domain
VTEAQQTTGPDAELLASFSSPVRKLALRFASEDVTAWQLASALLDAHPDYGGQPLQPLAAREGAARPVGEWLTLVARLFDRDAVAASRSEVIDGRLMLLGLARLDPELDRLLRRSRLYRQLEHDLGFPLGSVFLPWALPAPPTEFLQLWDLGHDGLVRHCAFSSDGRLLATASVDRTARLWDVATGRQQAVLQGHRKAVLHCAFSPDGRLLATASDDGTARLWHVAIGHEQAVLQGHTERVLHCAFSPDGRLLATGSFDRTARLWEEFEPPAFQPAVTPDSEHGEDRIGIDQDATALANVIAARSTMPPMSIGLFGDWGSGKSFLINEIQQRVRRLALRSRRSQGSIYCSYVRNVVFNAWNYADANLWASLVTHIFDELAKPEPEAGFAGSQAAQVARLEEELAAGSALRQQLERARVHTQRVEARKQLLRWTWGLVGAPSAAEDLVNLRASVRLLLPTTRARLAVIGVALAIGAVIGVVLARLGVDRTVQLASAMATSLAALAGWVSLGIRRVARLLHQAGETAKVANLQSADIDAQLAAAQAQERELHKELADLASGRRLARFVGERSADYRTHLGLVSRIHDDFSRMSQMLPTDSSWRPPAPAESSEPEPTPATRQRLRGVLRSLLQRLRRGRVIAAPTDEAEHTDLPVIDRIVLYIDDLDRCPPARVVEVLEAVHLILALPLFVVVIAVDPRWLVHSLHLHYSQLLATARHREADGRSSIPVSGAGEYRADAAAHGANGSEAAWHPTPVNYLEKIIQIPFALRPVGPSGAKKLVESLLPLQAQQPTDAGGPRAGDQVSPAGNGEDSDTAATEEEHADRGAARRPDQPPPLQPAPSLSPRALDLTAAERDFAATVASRLRTPRTIKKFTNLYRLLRVRLDEYSGELDQFLDEGGSDIPEYQAVLILLAVIIMFPDQASEFLLSLGNLDPEAEPDERSWHDHLESLRVADDQLIAFVEELTAQATHGETSTREPFRRRALEVSRYSFTTGQQVFARQHNGARLGPAE